MKLLVFGQPELRTDQMVFEKLLKKGAVNGWKIERRSSTSRDDIASMAVYDVVATPAIILTRDDGQPMYTWQHRLPSFDEIANRYI